MNQAYVFIKPHAVGNTKVIDFVKDVFAKNKIRIINEGMIEGARIDSDGLIDQHYSVNAHVGTIKDPAELAVNAAAKETFKKTFGSDWDQAVQSGKVISGLEVQKKLGYATGVELREIWDGYGAQKVTGGMYVSYFDNEDLFVLNGFYPSIREIFTNESARIMTFLVEFDSADLSWFDFRHKVIGVTNPADADPASVRGYLNEHGPAEYDITVSCGDNVIHASASPFEAFVEKNIWLDDFDRKSDPLCKALDEQGIAGEQILKWFDDNPFIIYDGEEDHLVDVLEDKDTPLVAEILAAL